MLAVLPFENLTGDPTKEYLADGLTEETIWRKDAIGLWLIEKDGVTKRLRADGEDPRIFRTLVEEGVNLHVELIPRTRFKRMVEGSARSMGIETVFQDLALAPNRDVVHNIFLGREVYYGGIATPMRVLNMRAMRRGDDHAELAG